MAEEEQKKSSAGCIAAITIVLIISAVLSLIIVLVVIPALQGRGVTETTVNTDGAGKLFSRSANNGDIELETSSRIFPLSYEIIITPNTDIKNLQFTFVFIDENDNEVVTRNYILGNVTKGVNYSISYGLSEISVTQMSKIAGVKARVIGGTVSYFA